MTKPMKDCPYCGEEILAKANFCRYCKNTLDEASIQAALSSFIKKTETSREGIGPGDIGMVKGDITNVQKTDSHNTTGAASVGNEIFQTGSEKEKPPVESGGRCDICGDFNTQKESFYCKVCKRDLLCKNHRDNKTYLCGECLDKKEKAEEKRRKQAEEKREAEIRRQDDSAFENAKAEGTRKSLRTYLAAFPDGSHKMEIGKLYESLPPDTVTDIDGNVYKTVKIGEQWWMAENLKVTHYRNGDIIPNVTDDDEWAELETEAVCVFDNKESNVKTYGRLYNWYAVNDMRKLAPKGWHVPTDEEWKELEKHLGMSETEANEYGSRGETANVGGKLKSIGTAHWKSPNDGADNSSGFSGLPGGYRYTNNGYYYYMGDYAYFWSSSESSGDDAWRRRLYNNNSEVYRGGGDKKYGFSVRCVRD